MDVVIDRRCDVTPETKPAPDWYRWRPATLLPNHNGTVWVWCPDIGNDDDGYGYVMVGRYERDLIAAPLGAWYDTHGKILARIERVGQWAEMNMPEPPEAPTAKRKRR